jgi:ParB family chromosome partitioning protein
MKRLGRGLDFLLAQEPSAETRPAQTLSVDLIDPNPWQPRQEVDSAKIDELAESLRRVGVIQPIVVRPGAGGRYQLVAGQRRLLAARRAGMPEIPTVIRPVSDDQMPLVALVENIHREDLNPLERAQAFDRLTRESQLSHEAIAELTGIARSTVTNSLRLLDLDAASMQLLREAKITEGHARALLSEPDLARRQSLRDSIVSGGLSVRKSEDESRKSASKRPPAGRRSADAARLAKTISEKLGTKVEIHEAGTKGRIVVHYSSLQEFERLYVRMTGESPETE